MQGLGVVGGITQRGARSEDEKDVEIRYAGSKGKVENDTIIF